MEEKLRQEQELAMREGTLHALPHHTILVKLSREAQRDNESEGSDDLERKCSVNHNFDKVTDKVLQVVRWNSSTRMPRQTNPNSRSPRLATKLATPPLDPTSTSPIFDLCTRTKGKTRTRCGRPPCQRRLRRP